MKELNKENITKVVSQVLEGYSAIILHMIHDHKSYEALIEDIITIYKNHEIKEIITALEDNPFVNGIEEMTLEKFSFLDILKMYDVVVKIFQERIDVVVDFVNQVIEETSIIKLIQSQKKEIKK